MNKSEFEVVRRLTFGQAEGLEPTPSQLQKNDMPAKLRVRLWMIFSDLIDENTKIDSDYQRILSYELRNLFVEYQIEIQERFVEDYPYHPDEIKDLIKSIFTDGDYLDVFNFIQFMLYNYVSDEDLAIDVDMVLKKYLSAYRVIDGNILTAVGSEEEFFAIKSAVETTRIFGAKGARAHLRNAIEAINNSNFSGSVRESISAVESVSKILSSNPKADLSKALLALEKTTKMHGGLRAAFSSLYGYASDEKGVRHSLLFADEASVDESDALFMIGACSSFVSYLLSKAADAGIPLSSNSE